MKKAGFILILTSLVLLTSSVVGAGPIYWNTAGGTWHDATNWSPAHIPLLGDDVVTHGGLITVDSDVTINSLTLGGSDTPSTLTLNSGMFTIDSVCINDPSTGLCWDNYDSVTLINWSAAGTYCSGNGLRLPTIEELVTFATEGAKQYSGLWQYLYGSTHDLLSGLEARGYGYTGLTVADYWSSTESSSSPPNGAWIVDFSRAYVYSSAKSYACYVRCVRPVQ